MESKTIKLIGRVIGVNKINSVFINSIKVENGKLTLTNLDTTVTIKTGNTGNKIISFDNFEKTLDVENATVVSTDMNDYPKLPAVKTIKELDVKLFSTSYSEYFNFASDDEKRQVLQLAHIGNNYVTATDGHKLIIDKNITSEIPFSISKEVSKLLEIVLKTEKINYASIDFENEFNSMLHLKSDSFEIVSKFDNSPYPDVLKVIPSQKNQTSLYFTESDIQLLKASFDKILPYANSKTHLVRLSGKTLSVINRDTDQYVKIELPFDITPVININEKIENSFVVTDKTEGLEIGLNAEYASMILGNIKTGCTVGYGNKGNFDQTISAVTFNCENQPDFLIMPLRVIMKDENGDTVDNSKIVLKEIGLPELKTSKKKISSVKKSEYYLFAIESLFGITKDMNMQNIIKRLSELEFNTLVKMGVNVVT